MMIKEAPVDRARTKEMKLKLPVSLHIKLHSVKVVHGRQISDTVREAIEQYFASNPDLRGADAVVRSASFASEE